MVLRSLCIKYDSNAHIRFGEIWEIALHPPWGATQQDAMGKKSKFFLLFSFKYSFYPLALVKLTPLLCFLSAQVTAHNARTDTRSPGSWRFNLSKKNYLNLVTCLTRQITVFTVHLREYLVPQNCLSPLAAKLKLFFSFLTRHSGSSYFLWLKSWEKTASIGLEHM